MTELSEWSEVFLRSCARGFPILLFSVVFWVWPTLAYALVARSRLFGRAIALGCGLGLTFSGVWFGYWTLEALRFGVFCHAICGLIATGIFFSRRFLKRVNRVLLFSIFFAVCFVLPVRLLPNQFAAPFSIYGWYFAFKAYSYAVEQREDDTLRDCLYFLMVNPVLVYAGPPGPSVTGPLRAGLRFSAGLLVVLVGYGLRGIAAVFGMENAEPTILGAACFFLSLYALHSGVTSVRIGLIRATGRHAAEGYHYPLFARNMADFWRRWNTYVGHWFRRYLFSPIVLGIARRKRSIPLDVSKAVALFVTFVAVGVAHDAQIIARSGSLLVRNTTFFMAAALLLLLWIGVERLLTRATVMARLTKFVPLSRVALLIVLLVVAGERWRP